MKRSMPTSLYLPLLLLGAAALLFLEWHCDEVTVVLAFLLGVAALLGFLAPRFGLLSGIVIGLAIPLAHLASEWSGHLRPAYMTAPPARGDWLMMTALILPALAAAFAGAWARRQVASRDPAV
jgi:hypothetical protein